ncbi:MAG: hypothetical protein E2P03_06805 [Acidobacteria bacterium]|nr:MAG: hypothetical protein E2P03_06805 [Acidobacteriota bacterium]
MTRRPSLRLTMTISAVLTLTFAVLVPAATPAAVEAAVWATADGFSPGHFQDHEMGHDDVMGPNESYAVGRWSGPTRHGSYSGFTLPAQTWVPTVVQVMLAGYVTGPLQNEYLRVTLDTAQGTYGPLTLRAARANEHVGSANAGYWVIDFSSFYVFPAGALQGTVDVDIKLMSQGPDSGYELHLDAIGLNVRLEDPNELFDLWLGDDASALDGSASYLQGVAAPLDLGDTDCPGTICFLRVRDGAGVARTLSVLLLADGATFRVGFVDGREDGPVDADLSRVQAPATAPADGVSLVRVKVTPRDGSGFPLGEGVSLRLDPASLGRAEAVGGFTHQGDGSYVIELKSASIGDARLVVQADGVTLSQAPVISFLAP